MGRCPTSASTPTESQRCAPLAGHDRHGALAHERDGHRVGAHAVARDAAGGVGGAKEKLAMTRQRPEPKCEPAGIGLSPCSIPVSGDSAPSGRDSESGRCGSSQSRPHSGQSNGHSSRGE